MHKRVESIWKIPLGRFAGRAEGRGRYGKRREKGAEERRRGIKRWRRSGKGGAEFRVPRPPVPVPLGFPWCRMKKRQERKQGGVENRIEVGMAPTGGLAEVDDNPLRGPFEGLTRNPGGRKVGEGAETQRWAAGGGTR